uniref:Pectinesterase inhibitor domain-containing protein n=1 Tax=Oryza punctata TaxID=4537 RepID=A0A0E0LSG8_ORYPU
MATVLVVLIVVSAGGLSPPCAAAAKEEKPVVVLPPAAAPGEAPSVLAAVFVRTCCDTALKSDHAATGFCCNKLLPYADSFESNQVKVAEAAATILITKLQAFLDEMRKVQGGDGSGDQNLISCIGDLADVTNDTATHDALGSLGRLATTPEGKRSKKDLGKVQKWIKDSDNIFNGRTACELDEP